MYSDLLMFQHNMEYNKGQLLKRRIFFDWALIVFSGLNSHISLKISYEIFHVNLGVSRLTLEWLHCLQEKYNCTLILIFTNQKIDSHVSNVHQLSIKRLVGAD